MRILRVAVLASTLCFSAIQAIALDLRKDFGAVGDGQTDDTEALQQAFTSGEEITIPLGDFRFTRTLTARANTKIKGQSGSWNAKGQTTLRYDGPEGEIALKVENAHNFQMRHVCVDGGGKAGISVYWCYSTNDALLEDVGIRGSLAHGLYITKTWYAHFNRVHVRNNFGAGLTLDRNTFKGLAQGPVNYVTFFESIFHSNGESSGYDGEARADVGYGIGSFGANSVINFIACSMEKNGGSGVYLTGAPTTLTFTGCYIEHNSRTLYRELEKTYGEGFAWRTDKNRKPAGRMASIIDETGEGRGPIIFDNCYINPQNGVWLKGTGGKFPLAFRGLWHPIVYWSENANWVTYDSLRAPFSSRPGIVYRPTAGDLATTSRITFYDPEPGPSGHPAFMVRQGVRQLAPLLKQGLDLYVDTTKSDLSGDGRSEQTAFTSLQKVFSLLSDTQLDQEVRIHIKGTADEALTLKSVQGSGTIRLKEPQIASLLTISDVNVPILIEQGTLSGELELKQVRQIAFNGSTLNTARLEGSAMRLENCKASNHSKIEIKADWASQTSIEPPAPKTPVTLKTL